MKPPSQGNIVRTSAKAVITSKGSILLIKRHSEGEDWYTLPGGGQNKFETLESALIRECAEETGYVIKINEMMFVGEYIGKNHEFSGKDSDIHQIDLHFLCEIGGTNEPGVVTVPDDTQVAVEWVDTGKLGETPLYPKYLRKRIPEYLAGERGKIYIGDLN